VLLWSPAWGEDLYRAIPIVRRLVADRALVGGFVWGSTHAIDTVKDYVEYSVDLYEHPEKLHEQARQMRDGALQHIRRLLEAGADIIDVASDYAFNAGPFLPPARFAELVTPYLAPIIAAIRDGGAVAVLTIGPASWPERNRSHFSRDDVMNFVPRNDERQKEKRNEHWTLNIEH